MTLFSWLFVILGGLFFFLTVVLRLPALRSQWSGSRVEVSRIGHTAWSLSIAIGSLVFLPYEVKIHFAPLIALGIIAGFVVVFLAGVHDFRAARRLDPSLAPAHWYTKPLFTKAQVRSIPGHSQTSNLVIDLHRFSCGRTKLGAKPDSRDFFAPPLRSNDVFALKGEGFEVGTKQGRLDYLYLRLSRYRGGFSSRGDPLKLGRSSTPAAIKAAFGEPYWADESGDEVILFYEYETGTIELQFEFPDRQHLEVITLLQHGVLSDPVHRSRYGVTKPWPPTVKDD